MKLYAVTYDHRHIPFDEQYLPLVERHMAAKTTFKLSGLPVSGADIRRIEKPGEGEFGPHLSSRDVTDVFALAAGSPPSFWKDVFFANGSRRKEGRPWLYSSVIEWAAGECGHRHLPELLEFVDAEWEAARDHNAPRPSPIPGYLESVRRATQEFYASDKGAEYAGYLSRNGWA